VLLLDVAEIESAKVETALLQLPKTVLMAQLLAIHPVTRVHRTSLVGRMDCSAHQLHVVQIRSVEVAVVKTWMVVEFPLLHHHHHRHHHRHQLQMSVTQSSTAMQLIPVLKVEKHGQLAT